MKQNIHIRVLDNHCLISEYKPNICQRSTKLLPHIYLNNQYNQIQISNILVSKIQNICIQILNIHLLKFKYANN